MTNVPRNVLKPPSQNRGGSNKSLMLVTPDPFPSPAHIKKKVKGVSRQTKVGDTEVPKAGVDPIPNRCTTGKGFHYTLTL